jgi:hypothetical protein
MKLAIVGSRTFNNYEQLAGVLYDLFGLGRSTPKDTIISGGAKGADKLAKDFAENWDLEYIEFPAEWDKFGKSAGFIRNQQIVDACDMVLAFWDGKSRGTKDTIDKARIAKKPTLIVYF